MKIYTYELLTAMTAVGLLVACASHQPEPAKRAAKSVLEEVQALSDPKFNGGLTQQEIDLSRRVAADIGTDLPEQPKPCRSPNLTGDAVAEEPGPAESTSVPANLQPFVDLALHGSPAQKAVVLHAIALVGRKSAPLADAFEAQRRDFHRNAWQAEALSALTCEQWTDEGIDALVPEAFRPAPSGFCQEARVDWVLQAVAERSRTWPRQFFSTAWKEAIQTCPSEDVGRRIPATDHYLLDLQPLLLDPDADPERVAAALDMVVDFGERGKILEPAAIKLIDSKDADVAADAQEVVVVSGSPASVAILKRWLAGERGVYWNWVDYIPFLTHYSDQIVPLLVSILRDRTGLGSEDAAIALGRLHDRQAIGPLLSVIDSRDWVTTQAAVASLAQFTSTSPEVHKALQGVARTYWSGRVRKVAEVALKAGVGVIYDPFDTCRYPTEKELESVESQHVQAQPRCIELDYGGPIDHNQRPCRNKKFHSGPYLTSQRKTVQILWRETVRQELPHGNIADLSHWCAKVGSVETLKVKSGWIVGCWGFESSGAIAFLPDDATQPMENIAYAPTTSLNEVAGDVYARVVTFTSVQPGMVVEVKQNSDGKWTLEPMALLPSPPNKSVVLGNTIAYSDELNAVLFDPRQGISLLSCQD